MSESGKVEGKTFLITGGGSGLGAGCAEAFLSIGAKNVAILDISEVGKVLADKLNEVYPGKVIFIKCDIGDEESLSHAFNEVVNKFKTVDVVINNAGIMNDSPNVWRKAIAVNFQGLVSLTLKAIKHMNKEEGGKGGTIINIASIAAFTIVPYLPIYAGVKAAVLQFTHSIAAGLPEQTGLRLITMNFGATDTPLLHNLGKLVYDDKHGKSFQETALDNSIVQTPESAVKGVVGAFQQGYNKSVWVALDGKPVEDITPLIDNNYDLVLKALYPSM